MNQGVDGKENLEAKDDKDPNNNLKNPITNKGNNLGEPLKTNNNITGDITRNEDNTDRNENSNNNLNVGDTLSSNGKDFNNNDNTSIKKMKIRTLI